MSARADGFDKAASLQSIDMAPTAAAAFERPATEAIVLPPEVRAESLLTPSAKAFQTRPNYQPSDLSLEGSVGYVISGSTLELKADKVSNNRSGGISGALRLTLWATTVRPTYGASISGYRLGWYDFPSTLAAGYYFPNIDRFVSFTTPPNGTYYLTMTLDEFSSAGVYNYHDLVVFSSTETWGPTTPPTSALLGDHAMTEDVNASTYLPTKRTNSFLTTGAKATCWLQFGTFTGTHTLQWKWTSPDGANYLTTDVYTETGAPGLTYYYWFYINISGAAAAGKTGTWHVTAYLDGSVAATETFTITSPTVTPNCTPSATTACLNNNRFAVSITYKTDSTKSGQAIKYTADSGLFWFFGSDNIEVLVKILNGCGLNSRYWIFGAASTDVEYTITVRDTASGQVKTYFHGAGSPAPAITDTNAFATCP